MYLKANLQSFEKELIINILNNINGANFDRIECIFINYRIKVMALIKRLRTIKENFRYNNESIETKEGFVDILKQSQLESYFFNVKTGEDGNCFYRAISKLLFGQQDFYYLIKISALFFIFERKEEFDNVFNKGKTNFKLFLQKHSRHNEWADEIIILATSLVLNRPIITFSITNSSQLFCLHFYKDTILENFFKVMPFTISFYSSHYTTLMQKRETDFNFEIYFKTQRNERNVSFLTLSSF